MVLMYEEQLYYTNTDEKVKPHRTHFEHPLIYTASQPGYPISDAMSWRWHMSPHQAHKKPCKSLKIISTECC